MQKDLKAFIKLHCDIVVKAIESMSLSGYQPNIICFTESIKGLPEHLYSEKFITLDVSTEAVGAFSITDDYLNIDVRFSGKKQSLFIHLLAIISVVGKEGEKPIIRIDPSNSIIISEDLTKRFIHYCQNGDTETTEQQEPKPKTKPHLTRIK